MSTEGIVDPITEPPVVAGADGGQDGGGNNTVPNPFFESFKEKYGAEVTDEASFHAVVGDWRSKAEQSAAKEAEVADWKQKYETKTVDYKTGFAKDVEAYASKLIAEGTPPDEISGKVETFFSESRMKYLDMANDNPIGLIEKYYKTIEKDYTPAQVSRMVSKEAALLDKSKYPDHLTEDEAEQMYQDNLIDLQIKAKGLANILEEKKPKVGDFHPVGMMTKEQLDARLAEQNRSYADSFNSFRDEFKGLKVGDTVLDMQLFDAKGQPTPEFAPVLKVLNKSALQYMDSFYLADGETPDAGRIAAVMIRELALPALLEKTYERAKSDALKEFEGRVRGNGAGFGGGADGGKLDPEDPDYYAKLKARSGQG